MTMHATQDRNQKDGFGFTFSEAAAIPAASPNFSERESASGEDAEEFAASRPPEAKFLKPLTKSHRTWCANHAVRRNMPLPPIEEALTLLNQDRLLVENVLNTAEQLGFGPMTIVESILERRG